MYLNSLKINFSLERYDLLANKNDFDVLSNVTTGRASFFWKIDVLNKSLTEARKVQFNAVQQCKSATVL